MVVFGRVKKLMLRIRAFLSRARTFLRRNRYGWVPIRRAPAAIWAGKTKLAKLFVLTLAVVLFMTTSNFHSEPLKAAPKVSAKWVLPWLAGYHIGEPFEATLRITSPIVVFVNPDSLRQEGETFGSLEIRGRAGLHIYYIKEESEVRKVTEFNYTLQYLEPLSEGVFTQRYLPKIFLEYLYLRHYGKEYESLPYFLHEIYPPGTRWVRGRTSPEKTELYLTKRVQPGDEPFPLAGEVLEGRRFGWILKVMGVVVVLAVPAFHLGRFIRAWRSRPKPVPTEPEVSPSDKIRELWERWQQTGDYCCFFKAAMWARIWKKEILGLKPGALLPQDKLWSFTNIVLCSGKMVPESQIKEGFVLFLQLKPDEKEEEDAV